MGKKIKKNNIWKLFKEKLIDLLRGKFIAFVLKTIFKTAIGGGIKVKIIRYIAKYLFDEIAEPLIKESFLILGYYYERTKGKILIKALEEAKNNGDEQTYNDILSDV